MKKANWYKKELRVFGAMDLYGLDRETAKELCIDIEELEGEAKKEAEKEMGKAIIKGLKKWRPIFFKVKVTELDVKNFKVSITDYLEREE